MPSSKPVFVGRNREFAQLRSAFETAAAGSGSLVMLAGEPGIGKTTLCDQLAHFVVEHGGRALSGHSYEEGSLSLPYLPFVEALGSYIRGQDLSTLESQLGSEAAYIARIVPDLRDRLNLHVTTGFDAAEEQWRLMQAVTEFLRNVALEAPLLLVLEDLHWAERGTLDLLQHLAQSLAEMRLLIVGTYRDAEVNRAHPLSSALAELRRVAGSEQFLNRIVLRGLAPEDVRLMYESLKGSPVSSAQADAVQQQTEGNPFFVFEVVRSLIEQGPDAEPIREVRGEAGPFQMTVPEGLRDAIGKRLNRLSQRCNRSLALASVIGREFRYETLRLVSGLAEDELLEALEEAIQTGVLEDAESPGTIRYRFAHALIRQTLYEEISLARRLRIHHQVGVVLEEAFAEDLASHAVELAAHFSSSTESNDLSKAARYYETAAQQTMGVFAYSEAVRLLEKAIDVHGVVDDASESGREKQCDLVLALGAALVANGERDRVLAREAPDALALGESLGDNRRMFAACRLALDALGGWARQDLDGYWGGLSERYAGDDLEARALVSLRKAGPDLIHGGRFAEARVHWLEAIDLARQASNPTLELQATSLFLRVGLATADEERRTLEELNLRFQNNLDATTLLTAVMLHLQWGERKEAENVRLALSTRAQRPHHDRVVVNARVAEALFAMLDGRLEEALSLASTSARLLAFPHTWKAQVAFWLGDAAALEEELAWCEAGGSSDVFYTPFKASFLAMLGRPEEARRAAAFAFAQLAASPSDQLPAFSYLTLMLQACVLSQDVTAAPTLIEALNRDPRRLAKPNFILIPRYLGGAAVLVGRYEEARSHYLEAIEFCDSIGYRPELALTQLELAQLLLDHFPAEHAEGLRFLETATWEFSDMGMAPWLEKASALLEKAHQADDRDGTGRSVLSQREIEVMRLVAVGKSNQQIADELVISLNTVRRHVSNIFGKTHSANRTQAINFARDNGVI